MQVLVYLFTGAMAIGSSAAAVWSSMTTRNLVERDVSILLNLWAMVLWAIFSMASYDVVVFSGGKSIHETYRVWSYVSAVFGGSMLLFVYHLVWGKLNPKSPDEESEVFG